MEREREREREDMIEEEFVFVRIRFVCPLPFIPYLLLRTRGILGISSGTTYRRSESCQGLFVLAKNIYIVMVEINF